VTLCLEVGHGHSYKLCETVLFANNYNMTTMWN